jgi:two-component system, cell cycle sensor histidine kinase and response regulator CckA
MSRRHDGRSSRWIPNRTVAVRIALWYGLLGGLWIYFSGSALHSLVHDPALEALLETVKGWFFVSVTALLLGLALDRYFRMIRQSALLLKDSEARYRLVSENGSDVIWLLDLASGRFTYVSPSVERLRGFTVEEVLGQTMEDALTPDSYRTVAEHLPARLESFAAGDESARIQTHEVAQTRRDGTVVPTEVVTTLITDPEGTRRVTHIQGVSRDVSDRTRLEAQLRQTQKLEAIGQLAGGVAHDFNNILAAIMMQLGLLRLNPSLDPETRHGLDDLDEQARRAANLTRQLLMFSRRSVLAVRPLDLNAVVANVLTLLTRLIGEHIDLRFDGKSALPPVQADAGMMEQVLMNLVVNARDAMPKGGRITIGTSLADFEQESAGAGREGRPGRFVCLSVSDTGVGMDGATLKRIFEPFFTTKEAGLGTGLGLATVHGIVAQHQGWVEVTSEPGRGSTFRVFLPAGTDVAEAAAVPAVEPVERGHETILLVEDEASVRALVAKVLRARGYRVLEASGGQEAMSLWPRHGDVDLLLTDMVMPEGMTGMELTERLRESKPGLKAVISSGYSHEMVQAGAPTAAGVVYLPKPYEAPVLARVVRRCLDDGTAGRKPGGGQ